MTTGPDEPQLERDAIGEDLEDLAEGFRPVCDNVWPGRPMEPMSAAELALDE